MESSTVKSTGIWAALGLVFAGTCAPLAAQDETRKAAPRQASRAADERAIREAGAAFVRAYDAGDARGVAELFAEDAEVINEEGQTIQGREAITALFLSTFEANPGERIELDDLSIRFLGPDVAKEDGRARILPPSAGTRLASGTTSQPGSRSRIMPQSSRYSVLYIRQNGRWLQSSVRELADKQVTPHERLEPLEWLVGEWVDEGSSSVVHSMARWSEDGNFLVRDFTIQIEGKPMIRGSQRIGWDPQTQQITSWVFDSDGGHGIALWSHEGDRWVVKATGVLQDGRTATATQIYSVVNPHMVRWKSVDRTVGDRVEPDVAELVMVRKPPRPR